MLSFRLVYYVDQSLLRWIAEDVMIVGNIIGVLSYL